MNPVYILCVFLIYHSWNTTHRVYTITSRATSDLGFAKCVVWWSWKCRALPMMYNSIDVSLCSVRWRHSKVTRLLPGVRAGGHLTQDNEWRVCVIHWSDNNRKIVGLLMDSYQLAHYYWHLVIYRAGICHVSIFGNFVAWLYSVTLYHSFTYSLCVLDCGNQVWSDKMLWGYIRGQTHTVSI